MSNLHATVMSHDAEKTENPPPPPKCCNILQSLPFHALSRLRSIKGDSSERGSLLSSSRPASGGAADTLSHPSTGKGAELVEFLEAERQPVRVCFLVLSRPMGLIRVGKRSSSVPAGDPPPRSPRSVLFHHGARVCFIQADVVRNRLLGAR